MMSFLGDPPPSPERSAQMALVKGKGTKPEMFVRRLVHRMGYRYRLHRRDLPGHPDLTFPSRRKVIFVHGCFWHRHSGCKSTRTPKTRVDFWERKFNDNVRRDVAAQEALVAKGWQVLVIWECEIRDVSALEKRLCKFLETTAEDAPKVG
jgi:DNA mismatch endonuclease, patch repair protein